MVDEVLACSEKREKRREERKERREKRRGHKLASEIKKTERVFVGTAEQQQQQQRGWWRVCGVRGGERERERERGRTLGRDLAPVLLGVVVLGLEDLLEHLRHRFGIERGESAKPVNITRHDTRDTRDTTRHTTTAHGKQRSRASERASCVERVN
jgi:hypothetical protein